MAKMTKPQREDRITDLVEDGGLTREQIVNTVFEESGLSSKNSVAADFDRLFPNGVAAPSSEPEPTPAPEETQAVEVAVEKTSKDTIHVSSETGEVIPAPQAPAIAEELQFSLNSLLSAASKGASDKVSVDLMNLPDLADDDEVFVLPLNLVESYWDVEEAGKGAEKRLTYLGLESVEIPRMGTDKFDEDGNVRLHPVTYAKFGERQKDGSGSVVTSAATMILAFFEDNKVNPGTNWLVRYNGKVKNKSNDFKRDDFAILPIVKKAKK